MAKRIDYIFIQKREGKMKPNDPFVIEEKINLETVCY